MKPRRTQEFYQVGTMRAAVSVVMISHLNTVFLFLSAGTVVESVDVGNGHVEIESWPELKMFYDANKRSDFKLSMVNYDVASTDDTARNWTSSGKWQGKRKGIGGWPGGAGYFKIEPKGKATENRPQTNFGPAESTVVPPSGPPGSNVGQVLGPPGSNVAQVLGPPGSNVGQEPETSEQEVISEPIWTVKKSEEIPSHRHIRPPRSALRDHGQKPKKVAFAEKFAERYFFKEAIASEHTVISAEGTRHESLDPQESLIDAVQRKKCDDVIRILEEGPSAETLDSDSLLKQYAYVKERLSSVRENKDEDNLSASIKEYEKDLTSKKVVLNVYINCTHLISKAFSLKGWKCFEIHVQRISLRMAPRPTQQGRSKVLTGRVRIKVGSTMEDRVSKLERLLAFTAFCSHNIPLDSL